MHPSRLGCYSIDRPLAEGGFGTVYRARGPDGAAVAIKLLHAELLGSDEAAARFERETRALAAIDHPGIVRVVDHGRADDGRPWYAMELLRGQDLEQRIAAAPLSVDAVVAIVRPLCGALAAAHDRGLVHRDVKASNVFLCDDGRVVLLDFGVAKALGDGDSLTRSRQVIGTPCAMSPEQLAGAPVDARTDVYGLGALIYHAVTGSPPFGDEDATVAGHLHRYARRPRPSERALTPTAVDDVVTRAMAIEPDERYPDPAGFLAALEAATAGETDSRAAAALWIEVAPRSATAGAASAAAAAMAIAEGSLRERGWVPGLRCARGLLMLQVGDAADAGELVDWLLLTLDDDRVQVRVRPGHDRVVLVGGRPRGGPLLEPSFWGRG